MTLCQPTQQVPTLTRNLQNSAAFVRSILCSYEKTFPLRPINEFDCAIVLQPQALCRVGNGDSLRGRGPRDLQKELMLLWVHARIHSRAFTEMQKTAELKTKFGQGSEKRVRAASLESTLHEYIVARYNHDFRNHLAQGSPSVPLRKTFNRAN